MQRLWRQNSACEVIHYGTGTGNDGRRLASNDQSDVLACTTTKDTESPAGVFTMQLKPRRDYLRGIQAGDVMLIFMTHDGQPLGHAPTMLGIVDRVYENRMPSSEGATVATVAISGRDLGKVLLQTQTVFDPAFAQISQDLFTSQFYYRFGDKTALSVVENVLNILDLFYNEQATNSRVVGQQWRFPGTDVPIMSLLDTKTFVQAPMFGYSAPDIPILTQSGNVWVMLQSFANRTVNELFIDIRDKRDPDLHSHQHQELIARAFVQPDDEDRQVQVRNQVYDNFRASSAGQVPPLRIQDSTLALVLRQLPYDTGAFMALPAIDLYETELVDASDLGRAEHEVENFFKIQLSSLPQDVQEVVYGIKVNLQSVRRFGIRRTPHDTRYCFASSDLAHQFDQGNLRGDTFRSIYDYYIGLLSTWNAYNERMLAGTLAARFRPDIRVGTRIRFHRTDPNGGREEAINLYCQGVVNSFHYQEGASRTTLQLVRGVSEQGSSDDTVGRVGPEGNLYWTQNGQYLPDNPYTLVTAVGTVPDSPEPVETDTLDPAGGP